MEKKMENEMETREYIGVRFRVRVLDLGTLLKEVVESMDSGF